MSLLADLKESPPRLAKSSKFTSMNGVFYIAAGVLLLIWPAAVQIVFRDPPFTGSEAALVRIIGMTVAVVGWFYLFGGRSGGRQIVAASVLDRIILVPLVLIPIAITGVFPHLLWTFAILDPVLGLATWYLLATERRESAGQHILGRRGR